MIETKLKLWRTVGAAAVLSLAACGQPASDSKTAAPAETADAGEAGEAAIGESGGEAGEAGIANVFAGLQGDALKNARLQQLKAFVLVARHAAEGATGADAGVLVDQGMLEVYTAHEADFAGFDPAALRAASLMELDGKPRAEVSRRLDVAANAIDAAQARLNGNPADTADRMLDIAQGLYAHVNTPDGADATEYQHSLGAALAARDALTRGEQALRAKNPASYEEALAELNRLIGLWPTPTAPETPATLQAVSAQVSRVKLVLSTLK